MLENLAKVTQQVCSHLASFGSRAISLGQREILILILKATSSREKEWLSKQPRHSG